MPEVYGPDRAGAAKAAFTFVLILGIANLFADFTYEGARSINGQFLGSLGASAAVVGVTAGLGELVGYGFRSVMGIITDRTGRYWVTTLIGYSLNMLAVPALALAGNWPLAAVLIVLERTGRAVRKPSTDAMLSFAGSQIGHGWVFGLNEALDQAGATLGPLTMAFVLWRHSGYRSGYGLLLISGLLTIGTVLVASRQMPRPKEMEVGKSLDAHGFPKSYWWNMAAAGFIGAGFADFALIGFHLQRSGTATAGAIPVFYAVAMGVGAFGGIVLGSAYDRIGLPMVIGTFFVSAAFAPMVFLGGAAWVLPGMLLWGLGMSGQGALLKPMVARLVSANRRGTAFGLFDAGFGIAWFAGSAVMGVLYSVSIPALVAVSVGLQLLALPIFWFAARAA